MARILVLTSRLPYPPGEGHQLRTFHLLRALASAGMDHDDHVVALGGGVVGDLAGFVAATYNRGLPLLMVPTTLLAMVDSSVGGKTGVNHPKGKNLIGAFHQPAGVWIDTAFLDTLPEREFLSGLAEVVKYGVILDAEFFEYVGANAAAIRARKPDALVHLVARSCRLKACVVEKDEREETGLRAVLNYGHTFAHAIELVRGQAAEDQGEAVALGLMAAAHLAFRQGRIPAEVVDAHRRLLTGLGLPVQGEFRRPDLEQAWMRDKKYRHGVRFVVLNALGRPEGGVTADADTLDGALHDLARG